MKKHTLRVFLLVLLIIPFYLSCSTNRPPLAPPPIFTSSPSRIALTSTPTVAFIPTIYPSPTSMDYEVNAVVNALNRLKYYDEAIAEANSYTNYQLPAFTYADLCLESALHKLAAEAMPICDLAVQTYPNYEEMLYARGIARSITGDYEGAISDFELFLEKIDKNREKKYSSKTFRFNKDIYFFEYRIYEWIEILHNQENPITNTDISYMPTFVFTDILTSDFDYNQKEDEINTFLKHRNYEGAINSIHIYYKGIYPPKLDYAGESDKVIRQQDFLLLSLAIDMSAYSSICIHGCFAGDIDQVYLYCEHVDQLYDLLSIYVDNEIDYQSARSSNISIGIYQVYRGDYDAAKAFFENYLLWQQSLEQPNDPYSISDSDLEEWINKLEKNQFPFTQEDVYWMWHVFQWH